MLMFSLGLLRKIFQGIFDATLKICLILFMPDLKDEQHPEQFSVIFLFSQYAK